MINNVFNMLSHETVVRLGNFNGQPAVFIRERLPQDPEDINTQQRDGWHTNDLNPHGKEQCLLFPTVELATAAHSLLSQGVNTSPMNKGDFHLHLRQGPVMGMDSTGEMYSVSCINDRLIDPKEKNFQQLIAKYDLHPKWVKETVDKAIAHCLFSFDCSHFDIIWGPTEWERCKHNALAMEAYLAMLNKDDQFVVQALEDEKQICRYGIRIAKK